MSEPSLGAQLDQILDQDIGSVMQRERLAFDELTAPLTGSLVLFGAGNLGRKTLAGLRRVGIEPLAFTDNNSQLWNTSVDGLNVLPPREAAQRFGQDAAFVVTIWKGEATDRMHERMQQLHDLRCSRIVPFGPLFWKYSDVFLPHYAFDLPHKVYEQADAVRKAFSLWADDASRREFLAQIRWRTQLDFDGLPDPVRHEIYFPRDLFALVPDEVFVDCGAFDGDTMRRFLHHQDGRFGKLIAFEPDPANFQNLQQYVSALPSAVSERITVHQKAVGARNEKVRFDATGTESSAVGSGDLAVDCAALDDILDGCVPSYIKMDTEGSELAALAGAQKTVGRHAPALALCVYHLQDHVWKIPLFVHALSERYRFFLRPHLLEVWDLVCYAVPVDRLAA